MRRLPRWLGFAAVFLALTLAALTSLALGTARRPFPQLSGEQPLPGLSAQVEVLRDEYGVPQVYADNAEDLFAAQGYLHAQDRFYEMDVRRHVTAGRLAELFGPSQVERDRYVRTLGWRRVAEQELGLLSASTRRYLDAYASGVNAYVRGRSASDLSLEYSLLGLQGLNYRPEDWTAADSVSWLKAMAWDLGANRDREAERALMIAAVGDRRTDEVTPDFPFHDFQPILAGGTVRGARFEAGAPAGSRRSVDGLATALRQPDVRTAFGNLRRAENAIPNLLGDGATGGVGSNSWAVAGARTATGKPILSNDPHLGTSIPAVFTQVGLHCRLVSSRCPFDVSGFSFAGMPGVVIGKNAHLAWGLTTSYADAQDLYLEQVRGNSVRVGNSYLPLQVRTEQIRVAGEDEPRTITIRSSRHGPLLSDADSRLGEVGRDAAGGNRDGYAVALAWTALTPSRSMDAVFGLDSAAGFADFRAAAKLLAAPSQNLIYADVAGNIGYQLAGAVPLRTQGDGRSPRPGWDPSYDWKGTIAFERLPYAENPPSGYLVAANNQVIGRQYPYLIGTTYAYGWRSQQILDHLQKNPRLTVAASEQLQYDDTVRFAADLVPTLLRIKVRDAWVLEGQQTLVGWDYTSPPDSAAAAYFFVVVHDIMKRAFRDELPADLWPRMDDRWFAVLANLIRDPDNRWWDDANTKDVVEKRDDILLAAMTDARRELTSLMSRDTSGWSWGWIHRVTLKNQTLGSSGIAPVERLFNRGDYSVGGGMAVVNALAFDDKVSYRVTSGPTMRMTVDLANLDRSVWVNQSGVSGHAFHPNYDDQTELWATNRTWPFVSSRAAVEARTTHRLVLLPSS